MKFKSLLIICFIHCSILRAEKIFVNAKTGNDSNQGTKEFPLLSINEAARRININTEVNNSEIILMEGVHILQTTALFNNNKYTSSSRLIIRSEILPDEKEWSPQVMPVVLTAVPPHAGQGGDESIGLQIEVNHVTIQGIRFSGSPNYSFKTEKEIRRSYPIWRGGKNLDDLLVSQCLFAGNADVLPLHVGVIANGHGLVIDHCVFFNCKIPVVFWKADGNTSNNNAMHHCLVYGCYFAGVWTTTNTNGDDFNFHHNIISNCQTAWIRENNSVRNYKATDCIFTNNMNMAGYASGALSSTQITSTDFLQMINVKISGKIEIEMDQSKKNYLQLVSGSFGSELQTGLFTK